MRQYAPWPKYSDEEINAVSSVLKSGKVNYWTGAEVKEFEREFASYHGRKYAIAVANGTVALELALIGLGIGVVAPEGSSSDEVIVSPRSFVASASCVVSVGAKPIFADIDPLSGALCASSIEKSITDNTKAIIVVHVGGYPADMDAILKVACRHGIKIIEDCSQAHGAKFKDSVVGALGDVGAWSFCQDKIITTGGEGGMVATDNYDVWKRMWSHKDHGKNYNKIKKRDLPQGFNWLHDSFGTNWRMTEMQAAIGRIQLQNLPSWLKIRNNHASIFYSYFEDLEREFSAVILPKNPCAHKEKEPCCTNAYYRIYIYVVPEEFKTKNIREYVVSQCGEHGIPCFTGSCPEIYLEKSFKKSIHRVPERLNISHQLGKRSLAFLCHPTMSYDDTHFVAEKVSNILRDQVK